MGSCSKDLMPGLSVETSYDPEASQIADLNELDYGGERTTEAKGVEFATGDPVQVDFVVPPMPQAEYDTDKGELTITGEDGEPHIVTVPPRNEGKSVFPMAIVDAEGNKYLLDVPPGTEQSGPEEDAPADGTDGEMTADQAGGGTVPVTVTPIEDIAGGFDTTQLNEGAGVVVRFSKGAGEFAFDAAEQDWYRRALLVRDKYEAFGEGYIAPWKLVPVGENDTVEAVIAEGKANPEDIGFVLKDGTGVPAKENGGKWTLTLPSVGSGEEYPVFAVLKKRNSNLTVGKLNVVSYPKQTRTVTLVPVFERFPDVGAVERELNAIYAPYGVTFTVAEDNSMIGVWDWDLDGDGALNLDGSGFFSNETDEMKALRQAYQSAGNYDRNGYYLFVMRSAKADTEPEFTAAGDMPRGKQFGYLFSADSGPSLSRLAAHELGHGIFTLTHTFDSNYGGGDSRAQTPNLMDYADGTDLGAFQWSVIAKPAPLTWFDNEEDAMSMFKENRDATLKIIEALRFGYAFDIGVNMEYPRNSKFAGYTNITLGDVKYEKITISFENRPASVNPRASFTELSSKDLAVGRFGFIMVGTEAQIELTTLADDIESLKRYVLCESAESWRSAIDQYGLANLNALPDEAFAELTNTQRFNLLNKILTTDGVDDHVAISLFESFTSTKDGCVELYNWLREHDAETLRLYQKVKDENTREHLLNNLYKSMCGYFVNPISESIKEDHYFVFDIRKRTSLTVGNSPIGRLAFSYLDLKEAPYYTQQLLDVSPMEPIGIWLRDSNPSNKEEDQLVYLPAIYLKYLIDDNNTKDLKEFLVGAANIAGAAFGYNAVVSGGTLVFRIIGGMELVNSVTSMTIHSDAVRKILAADEAGQKFLEIWPTISFTTDAAMLVNFIMAARHSIVRVGGNLSSVERMSINAQIIQTEAKYTSLTETEIQRFLSTERNKAFFWSGNSNGIGGESIALDIARTKGGVTLEELLKQKKIIMPEWANNKDLWADVSAKYARNASGEINAVVGKTLRPDNVWENVELPALKANPNVTKITIIDPETRIETVIFTR